MIYFVIFIVLFASFCTYYHIKTDLKRNPCCFGCDYEYLSSRYVRGNDMGFGITNSFTSYSYRCKRCGGHDSFHFKRH